MLMERSIDGLIVLSSTLEDKELESIARGSQWSLRVGRHLIKS